VESFQVTYLLLCSSIFFDKLESLARGYRRRRPVTVCFGGTHMSPGDLYDYQEERETDLLLPGSSRTGSTPATQLPSQAPDTKKAQVHRSAVHRSNGDCAMTFFSANIRGTVLFHFTHLSP
jgi:hypothetical protein